MAKFHSEILTRKIFVNAIPQAPFNFKGPILYLASHVSFDRLQFVKFVSISPSESYAVL